MSKDPLLQPFKLKNLILKNRIMTTSHEPAYPEDGMPKERYRAYHEERAKAGVALAMTAGSAAVSKDSPPVFNNVLAYKDEVVPWIQNLTDGCHQHGCAVMIQLTHLGRRTSWNKHDWLPVVSSSKHREPAHRAFPKLIEDWDIDRIINDFADAAERMKAGGMDGIELQVYGHLLDQFWSPLTNDLVGPYGADTLENRMQFPLDVLNAVRNRVGKEFIIGFRYTADEAKKGGLTAKDGLDISKRLSETGQLDFLNIIRGRIHTDADLTDVIPVQGMPSAPHLDFAGEVKKLTGMPTFHASRIPDVSTARHAIENNLLDMVGMTRAHMADPHIVKKIIEGREGDIRPCVGATYCLDRIYQAGDALCIHNPATGRELTMPHEITPAIELKKIVIVGAGPAGLEAARVAAERGHEVVVFEAQSDPGGQIRLTAKSPRRREMISIIDWRMAQCAARSVEFKFNNWAEADDIISLNPDIVIIATGGLPNLELFESKKDANYVISTWDIISGDIKPAENILIYDESGDHPALQAAEIAANSGSKVEVMTPDRTFSPEIMAMNLTPYMRSLQKKDVTFTVTHRLLDVMLTGNKLTAKIGTDYSEYVEEKKYDQIIVNYGTMPLDDLYFELKPKSKNYGAVDYDALINGDVQKITKNKSGKFQLFRIGDAVSSRNTHAAIYDALRLVKDL
ncbi:NADH:flavin oxidoreductase [Amylibacter sp.]|jgi:2,4-dienoyl-CoA reductase-like NADH-dependent reductase (Old Yellow Enzyme family)/thioredoxin reductase|nr:NADH:flavin oxidoreductase [Amylibacter sp.]MDB4248168.1 NADH:flavin oxidoreductase [Amylibacter sp.]MDB4251216.1 NADH:flavin oxidoreductase [Amylibacter sp.]MDB9874946.1 NADH:flavin oxidoreductase [Amylibacter sp.]MDC1499187.1 NADH:flavin oxidoreductase [Amylibacter sp.]|tara:strand:- start:2868 stop:4913 length:2046 start_codon:yes stop_codon:yes gene_type:complete